MQRRMLNALCVTLGLGLAAWGTGADAQTLYKLIDKNGKVTYAEKPPKDFDGQVIRLDIDPKANTATLPKPTGPLVDPARTTSDDKVRAAKDKLEVAKKAYDLYLSRGGGHGADFDDWIEAEKQLKAGQQQQPPPAPERRKRPRASLIVMRVSQVMMPASPRKLASAAKARI